MLCVVAPLLQVLPVAALEVSVTLPGVQNVVGPPAVIVGTEGSAFTVTTVAVEVAKQPLDWVTFTVKLPPAVTVMFDPVEPLLHK